MSNQKLKPCPSCSILATALSETQKLLEILRMGRSRDGKICLQYDHNKKIIAEYEDAKK